MILLVWKWIIIGKIRTLVVLKIINVYHNKSLDVSIKMVAVEDVYINLLVDVLPLI